MGGRVPLPPPIDARASMPYFIVYILIRYGLFFLLLFNAVDLRLCLNLVYISIKYPF